MFFRLKGIHSAAMKSQKGGIDPDIGTQVDGPGKGRQSLRKETENRIIVFLLEIEIESIVVRKDRPAGRDRSGGLVGCGAGADGRLAGSIVVRRAKSAKNDRACLSPFEVLPRLPTSPLFIIQPGRARQGCPDQVCPRLTRVGASRIWLLGPAQSLIGTNLFPIA